MEIIVSSTGPHFTNLALFDLITASAVWFPKNLPALWTTFFRGGFKESSPVSNNCFLYLLANDKNPNPLTYFLVLCSIEYRYIAKL